MICIPSRKPPGLSRSNRRCGYGTINLKVPVIPVQFIPLRPCFCQNIFHSHELPEQRIIGNRLHHAVAEGFINPIRLVPEFLIFCIVCRGINRRNILSNIPYPVDVRKVLSAVSILLHTVPAGILRTDLADCRCNLAVRQSFITFYAGSSHAFLIDCFSGKCKNHSTKDERQKRKLSAPQPFFCRKPPPCQIARSHTNHIQYAEMPVWFKVCLLLCIPHQNQNYEVRKQFSQLCHDFALKIPGASIFSTLPLPDKLVFHIKPDFCTEDRKKRMNTLSLLYRPPFSR